MKHNKINYLTPPSNYFKYKFTHNDNGTVGLKEEMKMTQSIIE